MTTLPTHSAATSKLNRRRALQIIASGSVAATVIGFTGISQPPLQTQSWKGVSLGGPASISLHHPNAELLKRTLFKLRVEVERLETVFSLYRHDSEIAELNRSGFAASLSTDLATVLDYALSLAERSFGAFDPTVQPLWRLYADHFRRYPGDVNGPDGSALQAALRTVDYRAVERSGLSVRFAKPNMGITLNGVAQGYITDRIAELLLREGFEHALVSVGETRAIGSGPDGLPWTIGIQNPKDPLTLNRSLEASGGAVAVSGGYGTPFGTSGSHHIFDPRTGRSARLMLDAVVSAPSAMKADGLSTALYVLGEEQGRQLMAAMPEVSATITRLGGEVVAI